MSLQALADVAVGEGTGFQAETQAPSVCDSGAGLQEEPRDPDGGIHYADQTYQESGDRRDKVRPGEEAVLPSPSVPVDPSHLLVLSSIALCAFP